ncbi:MAG: Hsp20/alpha crystallin family protein [Thaumarchaeota archaeon]|nr:hypothetical protein [Nitrososphaerota archaeon]MBI3023289.1 hypothetical protein [Nitrososphaerota archaeon]MBI3115908.1 hypothetical protein [Nitrososphaerota archaeon]MCS4540364.1 Hsp20/alpha crystallin family protein [Nitrososphaerota archaeon]
MEDDRRRYLKDMLEELDRYFDEFEKTIEDVLRSTLITGQQRLSKPLVAGFAMGVGPEGKPSIQFFGDRVEGKDGYRTPIHEQVVDEKDGKLRLIVELPGVEKESIEVSAVENKVSLKVGDDGRKYMADIALKREVDPDTSKAGFRNGLLEIIFSLKEKTNKGYRRVRVV